MFKFLLYILYVWKTEIPSWRPVTMKRQLVFLKINKGESYEVIAHAAPI